MSTHIETVVRHIRLHRSPLPPPRRRFLHFRFRFLLHFQVRPRQAEDRMGVLPRPWLPRSRVCHWAALPLRLGHCNRDFNNDAEAHPPGRLTVATLMITRSSRKVKKIDGIERIKIQHTKTLFRSPREFKFELFLPEVVSTVAPVSPYRKASSSSLVLHKSINAVVLRNGRTLSSALPTHNEYERIHFEVRDKVRVTKL